MNIAGKLELWPIGLREANRFVDLHHRHHGPTRGHKFSIAAAIDGRIVGVVIVGRPVSRERQRDGVTAEVLRLCVVDGLPTVRDNHGKEHAAGAVSFLYGAAVRASFAMGYRRVGTYILASEPGTSLVAAGWRRVHEVHGRSWNCSSRPRVDRHPTEDKTLFERAA